MGTRDFGFCSIIKKEEEKLDEEKYESLELRNWTNNSPSMLLEWSAV